MLEFLSTVFSFFLKKNQCLPFFSQMEKKKKSQFLNPAL